MDFFQSKFVRDLVERNELPTVNVNVEVSTRTVIELAVAAAVVATAISILNKIVNTIAK